MNKYNDIGVIVINFLRPEVTKQCIVSLIKYAPDIQIYLGDQDKESLLKEWAKDYDTVHFYQLPYDCGISIARNKLVQKIQRAGLKYIMWIDNDFEFTENHNILDTKKILINDDSVGVVGGSLTANKKMQHYERLFWHDRERGVLMLLPLELTYPETQYAEDVEYYYCDLVFNFCVAKIEVFNNKKVRWVNGIKVKFEHSAWFLRLKEQSDWKVAYCKSFHAIHHHARNPIYANFRNRNEDFKRFAKEFDLKVNMCLGEVCWDFITEKIVKVDELRKNSPTFRDKNAIEELTNVESKDKVEDVDKEIDIITSYLKSNNIKYALQKESCLDSIRYNERRLIVDILHLAVETEEHKDKIVEEFKDIKLDIAVKRLRNTKKGMLNGVHVALPLPVVGYLESIYGKDWKNYE